MNHKNDLSVLRENKGHYFLLTISSVIVSKKISQIGNSELKISKYTFCSKNEKQKRISIMKNLSSGWIFVKKSKANFFFSATVHLIETPPRRDPFWITRKNKEHRNPCDPGVLRMDFLALKDVFYRKIRIPDLKIKIRIRQSQALRFL